MSVKYTIWCTSACNLNCNYCYENQTKQKDNGRISPQTEQDIITFLSSKANDIEYISFHGGEPLLNIEFMWKITETLLSLNPKIYFSVTTNGTILNERVQLYFERFSSYYNAISISIDGSQQIHDMNRCYKDGSGSYGAVIDFISFLIQKYPELCARGTITPTTVKYFSSSVKTIAALGLRTLSFAIDFFDDSWDEAAFMNYKREVLSLQPFLAQYPEIELSILGEICSRSKKVSCTVSPNVYIDGRIYPCTYSVNDPSLCIGRVQTGEDAIKISQLEEACKIQNDFCIGCTNIDYCIHNRCKFMNKSITGNLYLPAKSGCMYEHLKINLMKESKLHPFFV